MNRYIAVTVFAIFYVVPGAAQEPKKNDAKTAPWTVMGLAVQRDEEFPAYSVGTRITAVLHLPDHFIVGVDPMQNKVKIADDKKTNLLGNHPGLRGQVIVDPHISGDGKFSSMIFRSTQFPAKGAATIRIGGKVAVLVGKGEKKIEMKGVSLAAGVDFEIGTLKVLPKTKASPGGDRVLIFSGTRPLKKVVVFDADGKEIVYHHSFDEDHAGNDRYGARLDVEGAKKIKLDNCTVRIAYFETVEQIMVPINLETGVGF